MTTMYNKTILQKKMLFVWMMFTVNAPAIKSLKTTHVWKVDIYKKIPVLYNIYKVMQRCNWYEKLHMKFVPCPEQFISQKVQAIMTMQCTAMKWNPLFVCSKITQLHQKLSKMATQLWSKNPLHGTQCQLSFTRGKIYSILL